jgi:hypothetical protein
MSTVATGVIVAAMSICTLLNIGCAKENTNEIVETNKPKQSISETYIDDRDTESVYIDDRDISNTYIDDRDVQNNHYEYSYDRSYFEEQDRINKLEEQIDELKKQQTSIEKDAQPEESSHPEKQKHVQQIEPNVVQCDKCGRQGVLYENIMRWYDTDGNNNFTHPYCLEDYIESTGKEPAQDIPTLK